MIENIEDYKIAIVGGGYRCKALLEAVLGHGGKAPGPEILGVADTKPDAVGFQMARARGIFTTTDYRELFALEKLDLILELTPDDTLKELIREAKPPWVLFVDHYDALPILDYFKIKQKKIEILNNIHDHGDETPFTAQQLEAFYDYVLAINRERNAYARDTRQKMVASEGTMAQIINGSTIPTFVIDSNHIVTHWNKACERLTGYTADKMVGTDGQWQPFRSKKRPTMADLILDGLNEEDLWRHYGTRWDKSNLIEGGYLVEEFFPQLGPEGTWLFFTAVPLRDPEGNIVGAIETLWDQTRQKQAEEERERKNKELAAKVEELSASEQAMSQIINGSTIPTFVIDKAHKVTHWNKALERLSGHSSKDIVGTRKQWAPFYDEERPSMADVILKQYDESQIKKLYGTKWRPSALLNGAYEAEVFFPHLGKSGKWCWFTAAPIKTPEGDLVGAIETIWDKTEDRLREKEREQHTKELATFCSIYATLSSALSLEGRIKAAIEEVANIFLLDGICIFTRHDDGCFHLRYSCGYSEHLCFQNRVAGPDSTLVRVARGGKVTVHETLPVVDDQEVQLLAQEGLQSLAYIPILDRKNRAAGVIRAVSRKPGHFGANEIRALELIANRIGVAIENARLQEDVNRQARFQANLIESSNDGIVATDEDQCIVIFNPAAEEIFGYRAEEVIGKMTTKQIYPDGIMTAFADVARMETDQWNLPWQEATLRTQDNETIPLRYSGTILREKHRIVGSVAFFHDLREIKRLERELLGAERLAAVGQTVAGMAHCVKNILHGLKGGSYLVNLGINKNKPEKLEDGWQMVQRNIARTSDLVQDLLSYSKEREPEYKASAPNEIVADACDIMTANAQEHNVTLRCDLDPELGEVILDPRSLHRSLLNLISNAIDACRDDENREKDHQVTVATAREGDQFVRFMVRDNGMGMTAEVKDKLFSSFFSTKGSQGTGLGLLVTSKLIEEHQGTMDVTSEAGRGTTFTIRLPVATADENV